MATSKQETAHEQRVMNRTIFAKAGAVAYVIWGLLHLLGAWSAFTLGRSMPPGMASGRVLQDAWNLLWFSILAILAAVTLNWRNDARGWWINFAVVSIADLGFAFLIGSNLADHLVSKGWEVYGISRKPHGIVHGVLRAEVRG